MRYSYAIGIPTINRWDLLSESIEKYLDDFKDVFIYILDNGKQGISEALAKYDNVAVIEPEENIGVAASWNALCRLIFKRFRYAMIMNDDIYLGKKQGEVWDLLCENPSMEFIKSSKEWSVFLISRRAYKTTGEFDEKFFPAYFEDNDYFRRMHLAGIDIIADTRLDPEIFRNSMTIQKDKDLIGMGYMNNRDYYIQKWGGLPGKEIFRLPFEK